MYSEVSDETPHDKSEWFAIKTRLDFRAEVFLAPLCDEVFFPKESIKLPDGKTRIRAVIPHVVFVRTTRDNILELESKGRISPELSIPFWIYRYPNDNRIQVIPQRSVDLLRLLTSDDTTRCRIYTPKEFRISERVKITGGLYKGYHGFVKRIDKNKHVIVSIEGVCMVILPYIHPDLLEKIDDRTG